jgi:hypothetical protein
LPFSRQRIYRSPKFIAFNFCHVYKATPAKEPLLLVAVVLVALGDSRGAASNESYPVTDSFWFAPTTTV